MPFRAVVEINSGFLGGIGTNTWHGRTAAQPELALAALGAMLEDFYLGVFSYMATPITLNFSGIWQGVGPDQGEVLETAPWNVADGGTRAPLPPAIAQVVTWRTALASRSGRGRTFLGPMAAGTLQNNGTPTEESRAAIQTAATALIAASDGLGDGAFGVWSSTDQIFRDFRTASVPNEYAVLRSRRD
jgi:hypothetical protein